MTDEVDSGTGLTPVSPEMRATLEAAYAAWNDGGPDAMVRAVWHPDFVYHYAPDFPDQGEIHGAEAAADHFKGTWLAAFGIGPMTLVDAWWIHEGESVLIELTLRPTGESSGVEVEVPYFQLVRLRGLRVIECWDYSTREQAFEAAARHV